MDTRGWSWISSGFTRRVAFGVLSFGFQVGSIHTSTYGVLALGFMIFGYY
jgi:hypothetical protein